MRQIRKPNGPTNTWDGIHKVNVFGYDESGKFYYVGTVDWDQDELQYHINTKNGDYSLVNVNGGQWDLAMGKHLRTYVDLSTGKILVTQATGGAVDMVVSQQF